MRDLGIEYCGFQCKSPFFLAASPVSRTGEMIERAFAAGWAGVVTKSVSLDQDLPDHSLSPRFCSLKAGGAVTRTQGNLIGMGNIDFRIDISVQETFDSFRRAKEKYPDHMLIVSIKGKYDREEWHKLATLAAAAKADAIEACLSCPDCGAGGAIGQNPQAMQQVVAWIQEITSLPLIIKTTPHVAQIAAIAAAARQVGAAAVSVSNTFKAIGGISNYTGLPLPTVAGQSTVVAASGSCIKPLAQYGVFEVAQNVKDIAISGVGGCACAQDAIEYLLLGASTVQVATQVMHTGYGLVRDLEFGLSRYLDKFGYASVSDMVGRALPQYTPSTAELSREQQLRSNIDQELCINCGRCYVACRDGAYQAIEFSDDRRAEVDHEKCVGCGLCRLVCPAPGAIFFTDEKDKDNRRDELN